MSGHSKWSKIKRQKGVTDQKRGQLFTKLTRAIIVAAKEGGSSPDSNFKLRLSVQAARDSNMPMDNIERAIKKGAGEMEGVIFKEVTLEGYGPGGVAILVHALTDNHNRTVQEVRSIFTRQGGNLAESGAVAWLFDNRGVVTVDTKAHGLNTDEVTLAAIDAGAEDVREESTFIEIYTKPDKLEAVRRALEAQKIPIASAELSSVPKTMVDVDEKTAFQTLKLLDRLEELDEVQHVHSNANFSDEILDKYQAAAAV
ncbi:MAG: YebC/PmpR family DNA-binding transcriptional regulator [Chloroflexi bacterium]|nr:YebC/PmpR family DNA-binding transcriptional regulator [Chloroflexota bacterium]